MKAECARDVISPSGFRFSDGITLTKPNMFTGNQVIRAERETPIGVRESGVAEVAVEVKVRNRQ
jgi:hypothetical protein